MDVLLLSKQEINEDELLELERIYVQGFHPEQIDPLADLRPEFREDKQQLIVAYLDEKPVGFAIGKPLAPVQGYYARYIAVEESLRRNGIGSKLILALLDIARSRQLEFMVFEVDPLNEAQISEEEITIRKERLRFYEKLGARFVPCINSFVAPAFHDRTESIEYNLMWFKIQEQVGTHEWAKTLIAELLKIGYMLDESDYRIPLNWEKVDCNDD